jgi:hypothetical protein
MPENRRTKKGEEYYCQIDFFNPSNKPLKKLSQDEKDHIMRHIKGATYLEFVASVERQRHIYKVTKGAYQSWEARGKSLKEFPGEIFYPCVTCLRIAKKLGI